MTTGAQPLVIRPSSLPDFLDCQRRWVTRSHPALVADQSTEWGGRAPRSLPRHIAALIGSAVHAGCAESLRRFGGSGRCETGQLIDIEAMSVDLLGRIIAETHQPIIYDDTSPTAEFAKLQTSRLVRVYAVHRAPFLRPVTIESQTRLVIADGLVLQGTPDALFAEADQTNELRDIKTGVKPPAGAAVQLGAYAILSRAAGAPIDRAAIDWLPRHRVRQPQRKPVTIDLDVLDCEAAAWAALQEIASKVTRWRWRPTRHHFTPNPQSPLCLADYCPAHGTAFCQLGTIAQSAKDLEELQR